MSIACCRLWVSPKHRKHNLCILVPCASSLSVSATDLILSVSAYTFQWKIMIVASIDTGLNNPNSPVNLHTWLSIWLVTVPAAVITGASQSPSLTPVGHDRSMAGVPGADTKSLGRSSAPHHHPESVDSVPVGMEPMDERVDRDSPVQSQRPVGLR